MIKKVLAVPIALSLLVGCFGTDDEASSLSTAVDYLNPAEFVPAPRFTNLFEQPRPVLDIEFVDLGVAGKLVLEQQDGDYARYLSSDLGSFILQRGMLHSLHGFGEPLIGAELTQPLALVLAGRAGAANRFHTYVDGEDRAVSRTYRCTIGVEGPRDVVLETGTVKTTLMTESCRSLDQSFDNLYWVDRSRGEVIQSRQWVGDNVGSVVTRVTTP